MEEIQKTEVAGKTSKKKMSKKARKICVFVMLGVLVAVAVAAPIIVLVNRNQEPEEEIVVNGKTLTEEEKRITKQTIDEYINMEVKGYQHIDGENGGFNAVVIEIKNTGKEQTSLAIDVIARDPNNGTVLDSSSMYAEGIEPEQTYTFYTFVYSKLPEDQLKNAKYEIYKANTYQAGSNQEPEEAPAENQPEEVPAETPTEQPQEENQESNQTENQEQQN